jgi:hypothetical protein
MANDPPFAALNHVAGDLGIPGESALLRIGIIRGDESRLRQSRLRVARAAAGKQTFASNEERAVRSQRADMGNRKHHAANAQRVM